MKRKDIKKWQLQEALRVLNRKNVSFMFEIPERTLDRMIRDFGLSRDNYGPKKLSEDVVSKIRNLYLGGGYKQNDLAKKFNISQSLVSKIVNKQVHRSCFNIHVSGEAKVRIGFKHGN